MSAYAQVCQRLRETPRTWLVTGAAGFVGSHLVEELLRLGQVVRGLDNFATGRRSNLKEVEAGVTPEEWAGFTLTEGDLRELESCRRACDGVDHILHQGALGSIPRSLADPLATHGSNVNGMLNLLIAARDCGVPRFVYASSSSVYGDRRKVHAKRQAGRGDDSGLPSIEERMGRVLSPYAATKLVNEIYAGVFARSFAMEPVGLRYFNVFGPRQDPEGSYAAVIPKWIRAMLRGEQVFINGDGETSRDFCYVKNVVQINLLAATTGNEEALDQVFNVALQSRTSLNELHGKLASLLRARDAGLEIALPQYRDFRPGDVRHSFADVSKARHLLGYEPTHDIDRGLADAVDWYCEHPE